MEHLFSFEVFVETMATKGAFIN